MKQKNSYPISKLVENLPDVKVRGDVSCMITNISPIQEAIAGDISFLSNPQYKKYLSTTKASAVILSEQEAHHFTGIAVITKNPYYIYSCIAKYFYHSPEIEKSIHPTTVIEPTAVVDSTVAIGPNVVVKAGVIIGKDVVIGPNCVIGENVSIGDESRLDANVTLYHDVTIGKRVHIKSGAVIGSVGFGLASFENKWHNIPHLGSVKISNDVLIGSNTTIDRGVLRDTILEEGVKLDNLIQVGHNVFIGAHTVIAGCVAIAGSVKIGRHCMIGGKTGLAGHIEITDKVMITGATIVTKSINEAGIYSSGIVGAIPNQEFRKNNAWFHRFGNFIQRLKSLEQQMKQLLTKREPL